MSKPPPRHSGVKIGKKTYIILTRYASQRDLKMLQGVPMGGAVSYRGLWDNRLGDGKGKLAGTIYLHRALSPKMKRAIYDHEMRHAVHDIIEWDSEN